MEPIQFKEVNTVFAKDQPEYLPLPAYTDGNRVISCWYLTWKERLRVLFTGKLWLHQLTFAQKLQPQLLQVESPTFPPFIKPFISAEVVPSLKE